MALNTSELIKLAKVAAGARRSSQVAYSFGEENFSCADLNETLRAELKELAGTYALYRENKNTIFRLIEETITDVLPQRVIDQYGMFAEISRIAQGDRAVFTQRVTEASKRRAKQFVTKAGLAGRYEVFKLDGRSLEVVATAFGGAAQISIEEFLDGRVDFVDLVDIVMEGFDDRIYEEIQKALVAAIDSLQTVNKYTGNGFVESEMDKLIQIADSYGRSTIYCTYEFAATMLPAQNWISDSMKDQVWNNGYLANYKGHNVIVLRQSFTDETNTTKVMDPSYAWIIPTGADKPVKIVFEGDTLVKETDSQDDWSKHIDIYKKVGVGALITNNICVYKNNDLTID